MPPPYSLLTAAAALSAAAAATALHISASATAAVNFSYPLGDMTVSLCGEGDAARIVYVPHGANASFLRYQGYINQSALTTALGFTVAKGTAHTVLARDGWSLNVSHAAPTVALSVGGVVVSRDMSPPVRAVGAAACDPPKWNGLPCVNDPANGKNCRSGIGTTVATDNGGCLRSARSLVSANVSGAAIGVGIADEHIFGFGQTVTPGLSAVGSTKFIATFSRTLSTGPSHAPAPSYISLAADAATNKSVAHGYFLNTHGYSAFDLGATTPGQLGISSPDPVMDYFLLAGPTPAAVIGQFATIAGGKMSLPPKWAMGMKYDPRENGDNQTYVPQVLKEFAARGIRPDRAILEPAWQDPQYLWDPKKFPDVPKLIEDMAPTKLVLWEHPILDTSPSGCVQVVQLDGKRVCVKSDGYHIKCCAAVEEDDDGHSSGGGAPACPGLKLSRPTPPCRAGWWEQAGACFQGCPSSSTGRDPTSQRCYCGDGIAADKCAHGLTCTSVPGKAKKQCVEDCQKCADCGSRSIYSSLVAADCIARAPPAQEHQPGQLATGVPVPMQFSDLTLTKCQNIWKDYQLKHAIASGAVGFKLDEDDVDVSVGFNDSTVFPSGMMGYQFHNLEGYIWQRLYHEMFESLGKRTWLQSRGGYAGSQAYPTNSYSDGYVYKTYVIGVVNSGFSGLIWAPEMRHATCTSNHTAAEHADFARRSQLMFLSPQAQYNAWDGHDGCTLWDRGDHGGLPCGPEYLDMFKKHFDLRAGLQSYLYSAFETQSRTGLPLARPLVLDSPDDRETWTIDDQFMIGEALMFPPAGMNKPTDESRTVYFPETAKSWHSWFHNATSYAPGQTVEIDTPIMTAPLFVKGGVPVPYKQSQQEDSPGTLELLVWMPHTAATDCAADTLDGELAWSELYDDDGETTRHKTHGEHWRAHAGFGAVRCAADAETAGRLSLHFEVSHSSYAVAHERVQWTVRELADAVATVDCVLGDTGSQASNSENAGAVVWSHSAEQHELTLTAPLGHQCTVQLSSGRQPTERRRAQGCPDCSPDCAHKAHHCACPPHCPKGRPVPAPTPRPYESLGSIDIDTYENTIFWWGKKTYVLENIPCTYQDHAGNWPAFAAFANHSYARVRDFETGVVVANITSTIGFGFVNSFPDYDHNRLWLFGTPADRCHGNCGACTGDSCPRGPDGRLRPSCTSIQAWWTSLPVPTSFETAVAIPAGTAELTHTYNQGASRVRVPGPGMPAHRYVMISEPFNFFINADPDGNLTAAGHGWKLAPGQKAPHAAGGGVSMQWAPDPTGPATAPGWYYTVTGGSSVGFARSRDLKSWEPYHIAMSQQADQADRGEYQIAPYNGFAADAERKGWAEMAEPANWPKWGYDNNDGDVCCADQTAAAKAGHGSSPFGWLVWGASTQGAHCGLKHCATNAIGRFNTSLATMLASFFDPV
eukprot:SAG22_NODE_311_length_12629_cov_20.911891_5_plen_1434_part_00